MLRFLTAGESHGPCLTAIVEGLPAGLKVEIEAINAALARRQQGYGRGGRMKIEQDRVEILAGVRFGETTGAPIALSVQNKDWVHWRETMAADGPVCGAPLTQARPGHADLAGSLKYDRIDIRDILERASARETAARVAVGALARQFLAVCGIKITSHVINIGGVAVRDTVTLSEDWPGEAELNCQDEAAAARMKERIDAARRDGDTLGGVFEVGAFRVPPGLGSHIQWDRRLDARLAAAIMSIQAVKGVELGAGFQFAALPGSLSHDEVFAAADGLYFRATNRAGGTEGGVSNGETLLVRAVMKPIPTLMRPLASIDMKTRRPVSAATERSDVCAVAAASAVGEAMMAMVLAEALLEKLGGDTVGDFLAALRHYQARISGCAP